MYISRKLIIFWFVSICALSAVWYSWIGSSVGGGLWSSVLTAGGIDSISCTDVPGKIQDLTAENNIIHTQLEQVRSELRSLNGQKSELDISSQQIQKEKERLTLFEHDFFKETKFDHADELRTSIQRISLNLIDLQERITNSTNFIRNRLMNRKVRILEKLKEENTSLLTQYNEALNIENTKVQNKEGALSKASETLVQEIAQKENSRQNYETALQQLETLQAQLINKGTICAQSVTQSAVSNGSTNTPQNENSAAQTEQVNQAEQQAATSVANTPETGASAVVVTNTPVVSETVTTNTWTQSSAVVAQTQTTPVTTQTETVAPVVAQTVPEQSAVVAEQWTQQQSWNGSTNINGSNITPSSPLQTASTPANTASSNTNMTVNPTLSIVNNENVVIWGVTVGAGNISYANIENLGYPGSIKQDFEDNLPIDYKNEVQKSCSGFLEKGSKPFEILEPKFNQYFHPSDKLRIKGRCLNKINIHIFYNVVECGDDGTFEFETDLSSYFSGFEKTKLQEIIISSTYDYKDKEGKIQKVTLWGTYLPIIVGPTNKQDNLHVNTPQEFNDFLKNNVNGTITLNSDLDFTNIELNSDINFSGHINWNGKTIRNIKTSWKSILNNFSGKITNLNLENISSEGVNENSHGIGFWLIASKCNGVYFDNVNVKNTNLRLAIFAGIFCNNAETTVIKNSSISQSTVRANSGFAWGFIWMGDHRNLIINSKFDWTVIAGNYVGGIGWLLKDSCIVNTTANGKFVGLMSVGSIAGSISNRQVVLRQDFFKSDNDYEVPMISSERLPYEFENRIIESHWSGRIITNQNSGGFSGQIGKAYIKNSSFSGVIEPLTDYEEYGGINYNDNKNGLRFACRIGWFAWTIANSRVENAKVDISSLTGQGNLAGFASLIVNGHLRDISTKWNITEIPYTGKWGICPGRLAGFVNDIGANWDSLENLKIDFVYPGTTSIINWSTDINLSSLLSPPYKMSPFVNHHLPFKNSKFNDKDIKNNDLITPTYSVMEY